MKEWFIEYYLSHPFVSFSMTIKAETMEEAKQIAANAVSKMRLKSCYETKYK